MNSRDDLINAITSGDFESIKKIQEGEKEQYKKRSICCDYENGKWIVWPWNVHNFKQTGTVKSDPMTSDQFASFLEKFDFNEVRDDTHFIYLVFSLDKDTDKRPMIERIKEAEAMKPASECSEKEMEEIYGIKKSSTL